MSEHWSFKSLPPGEPIPGKTYRADGWQYVDLPSRLSFDVRDQLLSIVGEENVVLLASTTGPDFWRGQLLLSPEGQDRLRTYLEGLS